MKQLLFEDDVQFWFETLRLFGHASYGGSDFGEIVATASRIAPGDYDSWHDAWLETADRVSAEAATAHPVSARDGFLRASTYYRSAEHFLHGNPDDARLYEHLTGPKTLLTFTEQEGAGAHCHAGAQRLALARIFDWLDDTIQLTRRGCPRDR
ncbi:hypothetical protein [Streptomyces sp. NPDC020681]|uniref:hypothetical protein n=1 Tax=Streptomyces sp. NPDC020681 TaxID=3365083 RepID=UPI0037B0AA18